MQENKDNDKKNPFFDKRDKNYFTIIQSDKLFNLFKKTKKKCENVNIPETIFFDDSILYFLIQINKHIMRLDKPNLWLFNSTKEINNPILIKKSEKLTLMEIFCQLSKIKFSPDYQSFNFIFDKFKIEPSFVILTYDNIF